MNNNRYNLSLAFSPCPNDTFIFDALVNGKIKKSFNLVYDLLDIEKLNQSALREKYDIIKISIPLFARIYHTYQLLTAGSALGENNGPLLVARNKFRIAELKEKTVVIPGKNTTANFLMDLFFPNVRKKTIILFSDIIDCVSDGKADAGLLIHETRFTYKSKGLVCLRDFGKLWKKKTGQMLPLGAVAVKRKLPEKLKQEINMKISESVKFARNNPQSSRSFVSENATEMDPDIQQKHLNMYVNRFSASIGNSGKKAVWTMLRLFSEKKKIELPEFEEIWLE